ncbi:unnamed protein product, partial [marine sediment metagenome]
RSRLEVGKVASSVGLSRTPARIEHAGPTLGQHSQQVLSGLLGLCDEEITELVIAGAIE